eukprot:1105738-Amphidinium_carterae.1
MATVMLHLKGYQDTQCISVATEFQWQLEWHLPAVPRRVAVDLWLARGQTPALPPSCRRRRGGPCHRSVSSGPPDTAQARLREPPWHELPQAYPTCQQGQVSSVEALSTLRQCQERCRRPRAPGCGLCSP